MKKTFLFFVFLFSLLINHYSLIIVNAQWVQQNSGTSETLNSIYFCNALTGYCVGSAGKILKTTNGGVNWISVNSPYTLNYSYVKMFGPDTLYIATIPNDTILRSVNGGNNWTVFDVGTPSYSTKKKCQFINPTVGFFLTDGYIYRTTNGCGSWSNNTAYVTNRDMAFINENTGWLCDQYYFPYPPGQGQYFSEIQRTDNGGANWTIQVSMAEMSAGIYRVFFVHPTLGFYNGFFTNSLSRTIDGVNWNAGVSGAGTYKYYYVMNFSSANTGWFSGDMLIKTTNGGANFESKTTPFGVSFKCIYFVNDMTGWMCSTGGLIIKTTTGGVTFVNHISSEIPDKFSMSQNYPNPFNPVTKIKFSIPPLSPPSRQVGTGFVKVGRNVVALKIYDILGKEILTLVNEQLQPGTYEVTFEGGNLPSGVYFYKLTAGNYTETKKMLLIK